MFVKICGTTSLEDARLAVEAGADALGFIFAPSKRRVEVDQVAEITRQMPPQVLRVGVFTEPAVESVIHTVREAGLGAVQMHWSYQPQVIAALRQELGDTVQLWQVVGFAVDAPDSEERDRDFGARVRAAMLDPQLNVLLLDSIKGTASGGLGQTMPWERVGSMLRVLRLAAAEQVLALPKIGLAGGLRAENVQEAIRAIEPWAVDAVSGVEVRPGKKDPERMQRFVESAKRG